MMWIGTTVFSASVGTLVYVLGGYPLLLVSMARKGRPFRKDAQLRSVSIVIAVRNGEKFIAEKLDSILALDYPKDLLEVIVVSDGSDDRTDELATAYASAGISFCRIPRSGKAAALNAGIAKATNEILVLTDVRQRLERESVRRLIACFADPEVGVASGELAILCGETNEEMDTRLYWRYETAIRKAMSRLDSMFGANGPFYAIRRSLAVPLPVELLLDDVYLPLSAFFRGYRVVLEESARAFDYPTDLHAEFKRKVRTLAGLWQILQFYPQVLRGTNRMRWHFLSAKYGRLAMPWLLIVMALSTPYLPAPWNLAATIAQLGFYAAALVDPVVPGWLPVKRLTSTIRTFVVLSIASMLSIRIFFVPPRELWKETQVRKISG